MEDEIIFENEVLPELEIEELLTPEQMLAYQPRFVAFSENEISSLLYQLLQSFSKADLFSKLHKSILVQEEPSLLDSIDAFTNVTKQNFQKWRALETQLEDGTVDVEWEENDFFQEIENAKKASTYTLQQYAVDRVFFPFVVEPHSDKPLLDNNVNIRFDGTSSRFLKHDPVQIELEGAIWRVPTRTCKDYIMDTPFTNDIIRMTRIDWMPGQTHDVNAWIRKYVRPSFKDVIATYQTWTDFHELERILQLGNYTVDTLDEDEFRMLQKQLKSLSESIDTEEDVPSFHRILHSKIKHKQRDITDVIQSEFDRASLLLTDEQVTKTREKYSIILQSIPPLPSQIMIPSPYEIASELRRGSIVIEDITATLNQWYQRWNLDNIMTFFDKYSDNKVDSDYVSEMITYFEGTQKSIQLTNEYSFFNTYADTTEVKEGNDTRLYDGTPIMQNDFGFEEDAINFVPNELEDELITDATHLIQEESPLYAFDFTDGQREVFEVVWKNIHEIQIASGLPFDTEHCFIWAKQYVVRASRVETLKQRIPDLADVVARRIVTNDLEQSYNRIQDLYDATIRDALMREYSEVHKDWADACDFAFTLVLTHWWFDLCSRSLHGSLQFTPLYGMYTQHLAVWSYFGPPMEPDANTGILFYLTNIVGTMKMTGSATQIRKEMNRLSEQYLQDEKQKLLEAWTNVQNTERTLKKADRAVMLLEETIKSIKAKQRVDVLAGYLPALMYLPFILPSKRDARKAAGWIQGCCAAVLDEKFKADVDWKNKLVDLYKIKNYLAKERWTLQKRADLENFHSDTSSKKETITKDKPNVTLLDANKGVIDEVSHDMYSFDITEFTWIARSHIAMIRGPGNELHTWAKNLLEQMYSRQKALQVFQMFDAIMEPLTLLSLLNQFATKWNGYDMTILRDIKDTLRKIPSGRISKQLLMYIGVIGIGMPAFVDNGRFSAPEGMTVQTLQKVWNNNFQICMEWNKNGFMMTKTDIQSFITQVREKQKEISLERLDILTDEDRQLMLDAKNIGLVRIVTLEEIRIDEEDGANEFAPGPSDRDDMNLDVLE